MMRPRKKHTTTDALLSLDHEAVPNAVVDMLGDKDGSAYHTCRTTEVPSPDPSSFLLILRAADEPTEQPTEHTTEQLTEQPTESPDRAAPNRTGRRPSRRPSSQPIRTPYLERA
jgi:hypothetical protein